MRNASPISVASPAASRKAGGGARLRVVRGVALPPGAGRAVTSRAHAAPQHDRAANSGIRNMTNTTNEAPAAATRADHALFLNGAEMGAEMAGRSILATTLILMSDMEGASVGERSDALRGFLNRPKMEGKSNDTFGNVLTLAGRIMDNRPAAVALARDVFGINPAEGAARVADHIWTTAAAWLDARGEDGATVPDDARTRDGDVTMKGIGYWARGVFPAKADKDTAEQLFKQFGKMDPASRDRFLTRVSAFMAEMSANNRASAKADKAARKAEGAATPRHGAAFGAFMAFAKPDNG